MPKTIDPVLLFRLVQINIWKMIYGRGGVACGGDIEHDGRKRKRICRDLIKEGYILPPENTDTKERWKSYVVTSKAYDELVAQKPNLLSKWTELNLCERETNKEGETIAWTPHTHHYIHGRRSDIRPCVEAMTFNEYTGKTYRYGTTLAEMKWIIETGLPTGQCFLVEIPDHSSHGREITESFMEGTEARQTSLPVSHNDDKKHSTLYVSNNSIIDTWRNALNEAHFDTILKKNIPWGLNKLFPNITEEEAKAACSGAGRGGFGFPFGREPKPEDNLGEWWLNHFTTSVDHAEEKIEHYQYKLTCLRKVLSCINKAGGMPAFITRYTAELRIELDKEETDEKEAEKTNAEA